VRFGRCGLVRWSRLLFVAPGERVESRDDDGLEAVSLPSVNSLLRCLFCQGFEWGDDGCQLHFLL
jgi:hypothetical protein